MLKPPDITPRQQAILLARCASDKKAENIAVIDTRGDGAIADFFVICSAGSERAVKTVSDHMEKTLKEKNIRILDREGVSTKTWILLGTGDVIAHIFHPRTREFYNLEGLWSDCPRVFIKGISAPL